MPFFFASMEIIMDFPLSSMNMMDYVNRVSNLRTTPWNNPHEVIVCCFLNVFRFSLLTFYWRLLS